MRLAGYDLRERFRAALEASEKDRKEVEGRMDKADRAMEFLDSYLDKVESEKSRVVEIEL
jgi:mitofusin